MKLSIVIPNYYMDRPGKVIQGQDEALWFSKHCFDRIKKYTKVSYELILIDNGCLVGKDTLKEWADILITNETNLGFAKSCNQGFRQAKGEYICCMNNDIFVYEGWLEALLQTFEDNSDCGVAMPALLRDTNQAKEALELEKPDLSCNYDKYGKDAEFGSCWLIKKEIMDKVGLFDENFKIGFGEDRDYWRRVRLAGYNTYRTHKTRVFHQGNVTIGKIKDRHQFTRPNREYLERITRLRDDGIELNLEEKKNLKKDIEDAYIKTLDMEQS